MELPSGDRLNPPSSSVSSRRRRFRSEGVRADRISALPDDLLLQVLVRLRCARTAALTSAVARRWRALWRYLAELSFRGIAPDALEDALVQVARPTISLLEIDIPEEHRDQIDPARVSALLRTAARLAPTALVFTACGNFKDGTIPIEVPVFHRATSIKLEVQNLYLTPPAHGLEFPVLERLSVAGFRFDMDELIQRCPRLRVLGVGNGWGLGMIRVHSPTIEELVVDYTRV
ncbi:putative F-box/FBD/LRR-repeat protein At3g49030 [Triticum aestivum]|uniref:putative F-box/FBD/LRR-repeat protein At3g49030 n=1 Tax=Triticum aestivum TaxID=4565 RepID=UPI001D00C103|nr:putative F-box/FBD/LRR-repeat protein At3g49030 [Triticum aestivum]